MLCNPVSSFSSCPVLVAGAILSDAAYIGDSRFEHR
jgi:hypothetical protein